MSKNSMYNDLVKCKIIKATNVEETKVFEYDTVITSEYANDNKKYKVEMDNMTNEEIIIALLAKQTLHLNIIKGILVFVLAMSILSFILAMWS